MDVSGFRKFIAKHGAQLMDQTNEWEVIRYRARGAKKGVCVVYRDKRERLNFGGAGKHYRAFMEGLDPFEDTHRDKPLIKDRVEPGTAGNFDLYTDAGLKEGNGAWGAVLRAKGHSHEASGMLRGVITSSTSSEARGVANALHHFMAEKLIPRGACVRVVCDNSHVVNYINNGKRSKKDDIDIAITTVREIARRNDIVLTASWVKGHQAQANRSFDGEMNHRCDKLASAHVKAMMKKKKKAAAKAEAHGEAI